MVKRIRSIDRITQFLEVQEQLIQLGIGELKMGKLIGQGSTGFVFQCTLNSVPLAIKFIVRNVNVHQSRDQNIQKVISEYLNVSLLDKRYGIVNYVHFDVVRFKDEHGELHIPVIIMELYDGTLTDVQPRRTYASFVSTYDFLISTLEYLHGLGIAHNDLRPNNILARAGNLFLADFGIGSFPNKAVGQPVAGAVNSNQVHDIYALGKVLLYYATGKQFLRQSDREGLEKHFPDGASEDVLLYEQIINKCLDRNPQTNFKSIREIKEYYNDKKCQQLLDRSKTGEPALA